MISDNIRNRASYNFKEIIEKALDFCETAEGKEEGRYDIGSGVFALIQKYETKPKADCGLEAHKKYIDLQYVVSGAEVMGFCNIDCGDPIAEFNEEKDVQMFKHCDMGLLTYKKGDFAVFFPQDLHLPRCQSINIEPVVKVVVKIPVEVF